MSVFEWGVIGLAAICSTYLLGAALYEFWRARRAIRRWPRLARRWDARRR